MQSDIPSEDLRNPENVISEQVHYKCDNCSKTFPKQVDLDIHFKLKH